MNLLNFIDLYQLNDDNQLFEIINLHTKDKEKALRQCVEFFATYEEINGKYYFYTDTSCYCWYGGNKYQLAKSNKNIYFLLKLNNLIIEKLIIERRTATPQRQNEINKELTTRYNIKYAYLVSGK